MNSKKEKTSKSFSQSLRDKNRQLHLHGVAADFFEILIFETVILQKVLSKHR